MSAEDSLAGFAIGAVIVIAAIVIVLYLLVMAFSAIAGAGALWGLGVSSKNFFLAARRNIGIGGRE